MQADVQSNERPYATVLLPRLLFRIKLGPRRVGVQAFELTALRSASHPERIVEVALPVHIERREPVHAAPRGLVCVDHKDPHVSRWWHIVARQHAAPALSEMLAAYHVYVACVGGTSPQQASVFAVETTIVLAVPMSGAFNQPDLPVHPGPRKPHPGPRKPHSVPTLAVPVPAHMTRSRQSKARTYLCAMSRELTCAWIGIFIVEELDVFGGLIHFNGYDLKSCNNALPFLLTRGRWIGDLPLQRFKILGGYVQTFLCRCI